MKTRALACAAAVALYLCTPCRAETLKLLIWDDYIDPALLEQWKAKTGIEIQQIFFDSGDKRDEILANPDTGVDLAVIGQVGAAQFGQRGILEPLTDDNVPALKTEQPRWRQQCGRYSAPYFWGTLGILYRTDKVETAPTSWNDLLAPAPALAGHVAMLGDRNDILVPPLILEGKSINASDMPSLKGAFGRLQSQSKAVLTYDYVLTSIKDPKLAPEIYMALGYSGDQKTLNEGPPAPGAWRYVLPKEGSLLWIDCLSVVAKSAHKQAALQFLDFLSQPASAAQNALALRQPTPNAAAMALLPEEMRTNPEVFPSDAAVANSQFYEAPSAEAVQTRKRIMSSLVNFHDAQ